jgi:hypothetical protein
MTQKTPISHDRLRTANTDPLFWDHFEKYEAEKEKNAQDRFNAIDLNDLTERYALYRKMRDELRDEDHFYEHYHRLPVPSDQKYREYKLQCVRSPGYRIPDKDYGTAHQ